MATANSLNPLYIAQDLDRSNKRHGNFALPSGPTTHSLTNGLIRATSQNIYGKEEIRRQYEKLQKLDNHGDVEKTNAIKDRTIYPTERGRTKDLKFYEKPKTNQIANILHRHNKNTDGLQIQMPQIINENKMAAVDPSNHPNKYHEVPPTFVEEDTCPACFGTSICDQFYAGHIKLDTETDGRAKASDVYFGYWERHENGQDQPPLPVVVKHLGTETELTAFEDFLCRRRNATGDERSSATISCDVGRKILRTKLASGDALREKYVRREFYRVAHQHTASLGYDITQKLGP